MQNNLQYAVDLFNTISSRSRHALIRSGILALAFAATLLAWPGPTVLVMVYLFGAFVAVDGAYAIYSAAKSDVGAERSWHALRGVVGLGAGLVALLWPGITALALLYVIAVWSIVGGVVELGAMSHLALPSASRLVLGLCGVLAITFGVVMFAAPGAGAIALLTLVAATAILRGVLSIGAAMNLSAIKKDADRALSATAA